MTYIFIIIFCADNTRRKDRVHQPFWRMTLGQESNEYMQIKCYNKHLKISLDTVNIRKLKNN